MPEPFIVHIDHSQLCVFDPLLEQPLNDWTDAHVAQGFSWRPGSVSFRMADDGAVTVEVATADIAPPQSGATTMIRTPFKVPQTGRIEVGSVFSGAEVVVRPGECDLYFVVSETGSETAVRLLFVPSSGAGPDVVVESATAARQTDYLMTAKPA